MTREQWLLTFRHTHPDAINAGTFTLPEGHLTIWVADQIVCVIHDHPAGTWTAVLAPFLVAATRDQILAKARETVAHWSAKETKQ